MKKKAMEISPPSLIVVVILVLLVLVILLFIFGGQSSEFVNIINKWRGDLDREKCANMLLGRFCDSDSDCTEGYEKKIVQAPPGGWTDDNYNCRTCYECIPVN